MKKNNILNLTRPITLVGMMGSGKTLIGKLLSKKILLPFVDLDREIEKIEKRTIKKIFSENTENIFRKLEGKVLSQFLDSQPKIIATGGGAFANTNTRRIILKKSISIWLKVATKNLIRRVKYAKNRPLLNDVDIKEKMQELVKNRYPFYKQADITIDSNGAPETIVRNICQTITIAKSNKQDTSQEKSRH